MINLLKDEIQFLFFANCLFLYNSVVHFVVGVVGRRGDLSSCPLMKYETICESTQMGDLLPLFCSLWSLTLTLYRLYTHREIDTEMRS